jgi:hypothetical protein
MPVQKDSAAVNLALAHVRTWSDRDWDAARAALAPNVRVTVTTTNPALPDTDTTGPDDYMVGLEMWAGAIKPGSVKVLNAVGDDRNALVTFSVEVDFGFGRTPSAGARLYLFDEDDNIAAEQVVFYLGS